jgi:dihydroflavonol-4-reductase
MKPTLVTGANGHVGNNVCRLLRERGEPVRAMIRATADPAAIADLGVEIVHGDILDADAVARAVAGCGRVYHTAAGFLMWAKDPEREIVGASVDGTRHVMRAAARAAVEKVLYVSTSGTIGFGSSPDRLLTEADHNTTPHTHYFKGKIAAEREAFAIGAAEKLPVTAVNPGFILGPRFWKPSESTRQIVDFLNHGMPAYFEGGFGTVDVEDVARGALLAMERGRDGERYIVSGENVRVKHLLDLAAECSGVPAPRVKLPVPIFRAVAAVLELGGKLTGTRPMIDRAQVDEFGGTWAYYDSSKAERELGYTWRDARETVRRTVEWAYERGFARRPEPRPATVRDAKVQAR